MARLARFPVFRIVILSLVVLIATSGTAKADVHIYVEWMDEVDTDGDGYKSEFSLKFLFYTDGETDNVYEWLFFSPAGLDDWQLYAETPTHDIEGFPNAHGWVVPIDPGSHGLYDYGVIVWRTATDEIIGDFEPFNTPEFDSHAEEYPSQEIGGTPPRINSSLTASGTVGSFFSYTASATGSGPIVFGATPLPPGLSMIGAVISGTPTTPGITDVTLTASNGYPPNDSKVLRITMTQTGVSPPVVTPNGGTFSISVNVSLTCPTQNSQIRYTTDGSTPTSASGILYSGPFSLTSTATVRAIAYATGLADSSISSATFTSTKASQTIDFGAVGNRTFGDAPFTLNATASSGLPITFAVLTGSASINGDTITLTGAGNVTVRASQAGNSTYDAAPDVDRFFNVARASQTISFAAINDVSIAAQPFNATATASSNLPVTLTILSGPATINGSTITLSGTPGSVTVRASQPGDANYLAAPNFDRGFNVYAKSSQTITFDPIDDKFVSDPPFLIVASSSSGLPVELAVLSGPAIVTGDTVTLTGEAGPVTVRATQPGDLEYLPAPNVDRTFQVKPKIAQTINFNPLSDKTLGDPSFTLTATATSGLPVVFMIRSGPALLSNGNRVTLTGTGPVTIRASQAGDNQSLAAPDVERAFNVLPPPNRAPVFVSAPTAAPGTAYVNDIVTVSVVSSDPENDVVAITVNWGDGTTNNALTHSYIVSGAYTITVTLRDTLGAETSQTTAVTIIDPFPLTVSKLSCKFSFKKLGADAVQLAGVLPNIPAGFSFAGKPIAFDVGGATANLTLDAKGAAKISSASVNFKAKFSKDPITKAPKFIGGDVPFQMTCKGSFASKWADEGAVANLTVKGLAKAMRVTVNFNAARYSTLVDPVYLTSKAGVGGSFVKK